MQHVDDVAILRDLGDERESRLAYDQGALEIEMSSDRHEIVKHLLERIITTLTYAHCARG